MIRSAQLLSLITQVRYWLMIRVRRPYRHTAGFADFQDFDKHYRKHRGEHPDFARRFGYAQFADTFCGGPLGASTLEHVRRDDGATVRYNTHTRIAGVLHPRRVIGTCYVHRRNGLAWFQGQQMR
jgi:hypothetical protein